MDYSGVAYILLAILFASTVVPVALCLTVVYARRGATAGVVYAIAWTLTVAGILLCGWMGSVPPRYGDALDTTPYRLTLFLLSVAPILRGVLRTNLSTRLKVLAFSGILVIPSGLFVFYHRFIRIDPFEEVPEDPARAVTYYRRRCEHGTTDDRPNACAQLGWRYEHGVGVAVEPSRAVALYQQACSDSNALGCLLLGSALERGAGVTQDVERAVTVYERGCARQFYARACSHLGSLYARGSGVVRDDAKATELFRQACSRGDKEGCVQWALRLAEGVGAESDPAEAARALRSVCGWQPAQCEVAVSCFYLGQSYENGWGVAQHAGEAESLYTRACTDGLAPVSRSPHEAHATEVHEGVQGRSCPVGP